MSAMFPVLNPLRTLSILLAGQSWVDVFREKSGGPHLMNLLSAPPAGFQSYFGTLYGQIIMCGQGGTSTLKEFAPTTPSMYAGGVPYGHWWDETRGEPGPLITGKVVLPTGVLVTISVLAQAVDYWFQTSGFLTPADVASIKDAGFWQGQQDAVYLTPDKKQVWKDSHAAVITALRARINPADPDSVRIHLDDIGRRSDASTDVGSQIVREAKLELAAEMPNVTIGLHVYDVEVERQINPKGDDHVSDIGSLDMATRFWQSILSPTTRKLGPRITGAALDGAALTMPVAVEAGEILIKPSTPCGIRIEVDGVPVTPEWGWNGNHLVATLPVAPSVGSVRIYPIYGAMSDFSESQCIRYAAATSGLPITV